MEEPTKVEEELTKVEEEEEGNEEEKEEEEGESTVVGSSVKNRRVKTRDSLVSELLSDDGDEDVDMGGV